MADDHAASSRACRPGSSSIVRIKSYRDAVIPPALTARVAVEQASTVGWHRYVGLNGRIIGMHTFGASAPLKALQEKFGFTPERIVAAAKDLVTRNTG
jgi:transketolase